MQYQGVIVTLASGKFFTWYFLSLGLETKIKIQVLPSVRVQKLGILWLAHHCDLMIALIWAV